MGMRTRLTNGQKKEVVELYAQGVKLAEIAEKYGVSQTHAGRIARDNGLRRREESTREVKGGKKCPKCKIVNPSIARFCMRCGGDVRDEKEIVVEQLMRLREMIVLLPESVQGEADEITRNALKLLGGR